MARIKIKGIKQLEKAINRSVKIELNKLFRDKALRLKVGEIASNDIKNNFDARAAADATIISRRNLERYNSTDTKYKRSRVKALFSGALLNDLANSVLGVPTKRTFEVGHSKKKHPGYKTGGKRTNRIPFQELSDILVNDLGVDYFQLTDKARQEIIKEIRKAFIAKFNI